MEAASQAKQINDAWREHVQIVRGNPVRVYKGIAFKRVYAKGGVFKKTPPFLYILVNPNTQPLSSKFKSIIP